MAEKIRWQDALAELGGKAGGEKFRVVSLVANLIERKLPANALDPIKEKYAEAGSDYNTLLTTIASELVLNEKPNPQIVNPLIGKSNASYKAFFDAAEHEWKKGPLKPFALQVKITGISATFAAADVEELGETVVKQVQLAAGPEAMLAPIAGVVDMIFKHVEFFWSQHKDIKAAFAAALAKNTWPIWQAIEKDPASALDSPAATPVKDKGTSVGPGTGKH
jgi:hypothetical protein